MLQLSTLVINTCLYCLSLSFPIIHLRPFLHSTVIWCSTVCDIHNFGNDGSQYAALQSSVFSIQLCRFNSTSFTGFAVWYHCGHQHKRYDSSEVAKCPSC